MWHILTVVTVFASLSCTAVADLYRDDITYLQALEREALAAELSAITTVSEPVGIAQFALSNPAAVVRQLELARALIDDASRDPLVGLVKLGFTTPEVQTAVVRFVESLAPKTPIRTDQLLQFVMQLLDTEGHWDHLWADAPALNDFTGLECAPNAVPTHLLGPSMHQYLMRIAHPNMEFSLWRVDPETARRYPVAVTSEVNLSSYVWVNRFSQPFAQLDRGQLQMTLSDGQTLACARVPAEVMRAHHDYQREVRVADKQL